MKIKIRINPKKSVRWIGIVIFGAKLVIDGVANPCSSIFDEKMTCNHYES